MRDPDEKRPVIITWNICLKVGITVFALYLAFTLWKPVIRLAWKLLDAAAPLFIGVAIAYIVNILMSLYERHFFMKNSGNKWVKRTKRILCLFFALSTVMGLVILILAIIIPQLGSAIAVITRKIPSTLTAISRNEELMRFIPDGIAQSIRELDYNGLIAGIIQFLANGASVSDGTGSITSAITSFSSRFMTIFMGFIFSIYILVSKERLKRQFSNLFRVYIGTQWTARIIPVLQITNECFHNYIVGQVAEAVIIGVLCFLGMWVLSLPYAAMIGTVVGVTALIPVFGCYLGAAVGVLMCLASSFMEAVIFLAFICVLQQVEGNVIYPKVVGKTLGLPGIWVLAAVTIGGGVGGIFGMLFSVPIAAVIYTLVCNDIRRRMNSLDKRPIAAAVIEKLISERDN